MKKVIAFLCVFMYFASPYRLFGHAVPEIIGFLAVLLELIRSRKAGVLTGYGAFALYMLFIPPIVSLAIGLPGDYLASFIPVNLLFYTIAFLILLPNLDMDLVLKYYKVLVYIAVGFFFCQELSFLITGSRPTLYLPLEMYYEDSTMGDFAESRATMDRSSSFFLEPAHFAQYILPYYCMLAYGALKNKQFSAEFFICTVALLLLRSGCGYIGLLAIFVAVLFIKGLVSSKVKIAMIVMLSLGVLVVAIFLINNPVVVELISRIDEISTLEVTASGAQSGFLRIWRGYFIYGALSPISKIFGVGVGSVEYVSNLVFIPGSRYEGAYMNGIQNLLVTGGIIGTCLFARFIHKVYRKVSYEGRLILVCMISIFFIDHMLFTPKMFLFVLIAVAATDNYRKLFRGTTRRRRIRLRRRRASKHRFRIFIQNRKPRRAVV